MSPQNIAADSSASRASWAGTARRIRVPLGFVMAVVFVCLSRPGFWSIICGMVVVTPGIWLRARASGHVRKNAELTRTGPYAHTRNPLYLGSMIIAAGFAIAGRNLWIAISLIVLFAAIYVPVIRSEEEYLRGAFPEFGAYRSEVPRLLPRIRVPMEQRGTFSRELYLKHREYNAIVGSVAMFTALVIKWLFTTKALHF